MSLGAGMWGHQNGPDVIIAAPPLVFVFGYLSWGVPFVY